MGRKKHRSRKKKAGQRRKATSAQAIPGLEPTSKARRRRKK